MLNFFSIKPRLLLILTALLSYPVFAQTNPKLTGPLGVYHINNGYCYSDSTGVDSIGIQDAFKLGDLVISGEAFDNGFYFAPAVDSCIQWNANRVFAIVDPPSEHGVYNQPADTALFAPYAQLSGPGMVQSAQRFSRLSQLYGGFSGVVLDDWNGDTAITRQVRDAVLGKYVDDNGTVHSECPATTPYNKLYAVLYSTDAIPAAMPVIDGISFWYYQYQNCCYTSIDNDINQLRLNFAHKEIMIGIYLKNTSLGWTDPAGVTYMLQHAINRYDDGDINGVTLFAGLFLNKQQIPLNQWNAFALPALLDSIYYPYLGQGQGRVFDCSTGNTLTGASIHVFCTGRLSGDTMMRSSQKTNTNGQYQFGLWAGNRNTDSTYYWLIAEKKGYTSDTTGFWIKRGDTTTLANIFLCAVPDTVVQNTVSNMWVYPDPSTGKFTVETDAKPEGGSQLEVYNMLGEKVYATQQQHLYTHVDLSVLANGVYIVITGNPEHKARQKRLLILQH